MVMSKSDIIKSVEENFFKKEIPDFRIGDTVKVMVKVVEGERHRLQAFEGIVIGIKGSGMSKTFTVRRISFGEGIERTFPYNSPTIDKIERVKEGKVRRAKLYYLRGLRGKKAKVKERERFGKS